MMPVHRELILCEEALDEAALRAGLAGEEHGAVLSFSGVVRRSEGELELRAIDYEAYTSMARRALEDMLEEAHARWADFRAVVAHRTGVVAVGEAAVVIVVAAGHRGEAFEICRWLIDELKARVPIWKREHLPRGTPPRP
jgi:molybdopterin synthase catalytic subunit